MGKSQLTRKVQVLLRFSLHFYLWICLGYKIQLACTTLHTTRTRLLDTAGLQDTTVLHIRQISYYTFSKYIYSSYIVHSTAISYFKFTLSYFNLSMCQTYVYTAQLFKIFHNCISYLIKLYFHLIFYISRLHFKFNI